MIDIIGHPPELAGYVPRLDVSEDKNLGDLKLPVGSKPIEKGDQAVDILATRGVDWNMINKFRIHQTHNRLVVPVYEGGKLVQYNSRRINRNALPDECYFKTAGPKPYKYAKGHPITNYFLGWEECQLWDRIILVENTFVSMWLRDLNCTATFGSHLSDAHVYKLVHSNIDHVTLLWDGPNKNGKGGANPQKAAKKLKSVGVPCAVVSIIGQPDDYTKDEIKELVKWDSIGSR